MCFLWEPRWTYSFFSSASFRNSSASLFCFSRISSSLFTLSPHTFWKRGSEGCSISISYLFLCFSKNLRPSALFCSLKTECFISPRVPQWYTFHGRLSSHPSRRPFHSSSGIFPGHSCGQGRGLVVLPASFFFLSPPLCSRSILNALGLWKTLDEVDTPATPKALSAKLPRDNRLQSLREEHRYLFAGGFFYLLCTSFYRNTHPSLLDPYPTLSLIFMSVY